MQNRRDFLIGAGAGAVLLAAGQPAFGAPQPQKIKGFHHQPWFTETTFDLEKDGEIADKTNKAVMLVWEQLGCHFCKEMHEKVFTQPAVIELLTSNFHVIQMNLWGERKFKTSDGELLPEKEIAAQMFVRATPTTVFLDDLGVPVFRIPGYANPPILKAAYQYAAEKAYVCQNFDKWYKAKYGGKS